MCKRSTQKAIFLMCLILGVCAAASAQSSELGLVVGAKITPSGTTSGSPGETTVDKAFAFEVSYAARLAGTPGVALQLEIPFTAVPTSNISVSNVLVSKSYSSFYVTPGLRLKLAPDSGFSPWVAAGVGIVHFNPSSTNLGGTTNTLSSTTKSAYSVGGGIDLHSKGSPLGFRFEARELYTGVPRIAIPKISIHNNVLLAGGIVLRF